MYAECLNFLFYNFLPVGINAAYMNFIKLQLGLILGAKFWKDVDFLKKLFFGLASAVSESRTIFIMFGKLEFY